MDPTFIELSNEINNNYKFRLSNCNVAFSNAIRRTILSDIPTVVFKTDEEFNGVLYRSNFEKHYTDVSPAWNFDSFKKMVEQNN